MPVSASYRPDPRFATLGAALFDVVEPARFPKHMLRYRNDRAAASVGLDGLDDAEWERAFAAFAPLPDNLPRPLALRYHGHQFGVYNPALGDGRGFLYAQLRDDRGRLLDLGTKGSGQTPWSRGGDGRLTLKGGVREVLATSMLEALGVDTSRSLSLFETGESLRRHDEPSPTRASVLVRLSHSHVRFGTFQRLAREGDARTMTALVDYCVEHFHPRAKRADLEDRALALLEAVAARHAATCAAWMVAGFVHGVLNTDNMNVTGESFDYGPYRFLPKYDPDFVAAYFDESGLYAFGRQPSVVLWNLTRLADALRVVAPGAAFGSVLGGFEAAFVGEVRARLCARLGVRPRGADEDGLLVDRVFAFLDASGIGFERFFFDAWGGLASEPRARRGAAADRYAGAAWDALRAALDGYAAVDRARLDHPYFAGEAPCTLVIDEIESLWDPIAARDDWSRFHAKLAAIASMRDALAPSAGEIDPARAPDAPRAATEHG